jgi:hypothetical protein
MDAILFESWSSKDWWVHKNFNFQSLTITGVLKKEYYETKFGKERAEMMFGRLSQIGDDVGIHFRFGGKTGNTRDSHRLIQLGKTKSPAVQTRVVEELFAAYFENEGDITSQDTLLDAAVKAGLDKTEAAEWLKSDQGGWRGTRSKRLLETVWKDQAWRSCESVIATWKSFGESGQGAWSFEATQIIITFSDEVIAVLALGMNIQFDHLHISSHASASACAT